jgi:O-antigen/teichoic acid export membrane protein
LAGTLILQLVFLKVRLAAQIHVKSIADARTWVTEALPFVWIFAAQMIFTQAGAVIVGVLMSPVDVANYSVAATVALLVNSLAQAASALSTPKFASLHAQARTADLQRLYTSVTRWTFWPSLAIALGIIFASTPILRVFGPGFERGYGVLAILTLAQLAGVAIGPVANLLLMTGHQDVVVRIIMCSSSLYLATGLAATAMWGTVGVALALCATMLLHNVWLAIASVRKLEIYPSIIGGRHLLFSFYPNRGVSIASSERDTS